MFLIKLRHMQCFPPRKYLCKICAQNILNFYLTSHMWHTISVRYKLQYKQSYHHTWFICHLMYFCRFYTEVWKLIVLLNTPPIIVFVQLIITMNCCTADSQFYVVTTYGHLNNGAWEKYIDNIYELKSSNTL